MNNISSTSRRIPRLFIALPLALVLLAAGCQPAGGPPPFPPPVVSVITVEAKDVPVTYEYVAQTAGYREAEVRARVTGILLKRNYTEGAVVKKGESLFTIDPEPFRAAYARTEADLAIAEARLAQAKREAARLRPVLESKAVSQKELDDAVSAEQVAEAEVKSVRARLNEARLNLDYTRVESPITGTASRSVASEGTLVSGPSVLLTTVTQTDPMYVLFGIPDRERLALRRDVEAGRLKIPDGGRFNVTVKLADGSFYSKTGLLNFADVRVNPQTGTSEARAEIANPGNLLRPGEFARVVLTGAVRPNAIVIPQRAVLESPKGKFAYIVNAESKAEPRPLDVGDWTGNGWIINSGLQPGDRVIVDGVLKIGPGAPVKVADDAAAPAAPSGKKAPGDQKAPTAKKT
jgi:membrane fusion protein (multidrug efflux system)